MNPNEMVTMMMMMMSICKFDRSQRTHCPLHQVEDGQDADEKTSQFAHPGPGQKEIARNSIENQGKQQHQQKKTINSN